MADAPGRLVSAGRMATLQEMVGNQLFCIDPIRLPHSMKPLAIFLTAAAALSMAPARVGAMDMTAPMTMPMTADQACARFAAKLQVAVAAGNIAQAQTIYSEGNQLIASHFNGATCPNVKAP